MTQPPQASAIIKVRVQPKASRDGILGYREDTLRVRVTAPPEGGRANQAVISLLASTLGVAKSHVRLVKGAASREKLLRIEGLEQKEVQHRIEALLGAGGVATESS